MPRHLTKQQRYYRKHRDAVLGKAMAKYQETKEEYLAKMRARTPEQRPKTDKEYLKKYYRDNKPAAKKRMAAYYQANRDSIIDKSKKAYRRDPEAHWAYMLKYKFGITANQYNAMLEAQKGLCQICGKRPSGRFKRLAVDHCHKTNKIRGLLCSRCNRAIGALEDSSEVLSQAVRYLEKFKDIK